MREKEDSIIYKIHSYTYVYVCMYMYMYSKMPFWIFLDALMKILNQHLTEVEKQIKFLELLAEGTESKTEHHYATAPWFITSHFACFISKREECKRQEK